MNLLRKTYQSLYQAKKTISNVFNKVFNSDSLTENDFESIEECLLSSDINYDLTERIINDIRENKNKNIKWNDILHNSLINNIGIVKPHDLKRIVIMVGINGAGKTTACAKLSSYFKSKSKKVILVAADTFRAAAVEQLRTWANRLEIDCISNIKTNDPASIAYDGVNSGLSRNIDHIIIDTAGRLHTSDNLMNELKKIYKVISKVSDKISIVMNLDANIGQNGLKQVQEFQKYLPIDGIIINKMDGTARGGVALSVLHEYKIPILFLGVGEKLDNLVQFDINKYINSLVYDS